MLTEPLAIVISDASGVLAVHVTLQPVIITRNGIPYDWTVAAEIELIVDGPTFTLSRSITLIGWYRK